MRRSRARQTSASKTDAVKAPFLLRHPRAVVAVSALTALVLAILGFQVQDRLTPTSLDISGTPSYEANEILRHHFGDTALFAILLQGPADELDRQGPELVRALRASDPAITTLSPWDKGSVDSLRPGPRRALILADYHVDIATAVKVSVDELDELLAEKISTPVVATQSGFPTLSRALQDESIHASERGELIALPVLLIVLLLVFRSPVAAAIPLAFGAITVFTSSGVLTVVTNWVSVDAFALTVCTMMGLALGVDYALLMVSRFREELDRGVEPFQAAVTTRHTAGRTTVFAGSTLILSMMVAFFVVPGALLASLAATVMLVVAISVTVAIIAGPAVLTLLGHNVNRWQIGKAQSLEEESNRLMQIVSAAIRRPAFACIVVGVVVMALALPAINLKTGPPSQEQLSPGNQARQDAELINRTIAPGFDAPFVVVAQTDKGTITEPERLEALRRWQNEIAALPGVQLVIGPEEISKATTPLRETGSSFLVEEGGPVQEIVNLGRNLDRAANGISQLRVGLSEATNGAGLLAEGSGTAEDGASQLASGLAQATAGSAEAVDALGQFAKGSDELADGLVEASTGADLLKLNLGNVASNIKANSVRLAREQQKSLNTTKNQTIPAIQASADSASAEIQGALQQIESMTVGKEDPNYQAALDAVRQASGATSTLSSQVASLAATIRADADRAAEITAWASSTITEVKQQRKVAVELSDGLREAKQGSRELANGAATLARESVKLEDGLTQLGSGALELAGGISDLGDGISTLKTGLGDAFHRSEPLQSGLRNGAVRVTASGRQAKRQTDQLRRQSPGIFDSGYFVLSALDGAPPAERKRAGEAVDLEHGGQAATVMVITEYTFNSDGSIQFNKELEEDAAVLAKESGLTTGVAGGAATLNDYSRVTRERIPIVVAAITIATFLIMVLILRAIPLAAIAVGLNLAAVAVAFGVLTLLFNVPEGWPFGGHSYVDAVGATMIFGVVFGLSIDYAVFLLVRMRERYEVDGDNAAAITFGLEKTARVITGAAAIMMAVFIAFAFAPIANVSQLGIGLTVAVFLDATVVRIVFLPSLMLLLGDKVWWIPRWLDRIIPRLDV